ncbi:MAG: phosphopentomutase [Clostridium sp.]|uniref:phosphopentomutase n=1 Tax=Clostridium sp. TaxID=1506 RepID=UPI0025C00F58|nr:phosphopentomutase [Clostridium sp.]MCF0149055.1 phosphopentomutase [Clostridium sp.]
MSKFIVIVLDGFGIGAMDDVVETRPQDINSNTCLHILERRGDLRLPNLEKLGLINIIDKEINGMKKNPKATYGKANLTHFGADTFFGHQEIMGTKPKVPFREPIKNKIDEIYEAIKEAGYKVEYKYGKKEKYLVVEDALTVADNIECDLGQAFNITSALDIIPFNNVLDIGYIVRSIARVPRVITFGGREITLEDILNAEEEKGEEYIGINAPKSGVYNIGYECIHLGYGVNPKTQVSTILSEENVPVYLLGKVADVVINEKGTSISMVDTEKVLKRTIEISKEVDKGFICCNVQETDLSGHAEDVDKYAEKLQIADRLIGELMETIHEDDILLVMADHGNDPTVGHSKHTREMVPLMIYGENLKEGFIGVRETLSDVGATVADYFKVNSPENGTSFLKDIVNNKE